MGLCSLLQMQSRSRNNKKSLDSKSKAWLVGVTVDDDNVFPVSLLFF